MNLRLWRNKMHLTCSSGKYFLFFIFIINESFSSVDTSSVGSSSPIALFESFADHPSTTLFTGEQKLQALWLVSKTVLEDPIKSTNLIKHLIKGQHLIPFSEIGEKLPIQLALPVDLEKGLFDFIKSFYLMFDISKKRMGAIQKLTLLLIDTRFSEENLAKVTPHIIKLDKAGNLGTLSGREQMRMLARFPPSVLFELLEPLKKSESNPLAINDLLAMIESISSVMKTPIMAKFHGEELEKKCLVISRLADLVKAIPNNERSFQYILARIQSINKKITSPIGEFDDFSKQLKNIANKDSPFQNKVSDFKELKKSLEKSIEIKIEGLISDITGIYGAVEGFIVQQLDKAKQSILEDMSIFINNPCNLSANSLEVKKEEREGIQQLCLTRKYSNYSSNQEFRAYRNACIKKVFTGAALSYDVVVKSVISKDGDILYISTFFSEKG